MCVIEGVTGVYPRSTDNARLTIRMLRKGALPTLKVAWF